MQKDEYTYESKEFFTQIPQFGGHVWKQPVFSDYDIVGIAGGGPITKICCAKCDYKFRINFGYKASVESIRIRISYDYNKEESCDSFKMKQALE